MEWYQTTIIILGVLSALTTLALFISRDVIKIRIKSFFTRKGNYIKFTELLNNKKINEGIAKVDDGKIKISNRTYSYKKEDVFYSSFYGAPSIILSEAIATSINPKGTDTESPTVTDGLILRVKATALGESLKIIKLITIAIGILGLAVIVCGYIAYKVYTSVRDTGIEVKL
jgi:hypothetical protein